MKADVTGDFPTTQKSQICLPSLTGSATIRNEDTDMPYQEVEGDLSKKSYTLRLLISY